MHNLHVAGVVHHLHRLGVLKRLLHDSGGLREVGLVKLLNRDLRRRLYGGLSLHSMVLELRSTDLGDLLVVDSLNRRYLLREDHIGLDLVLLELNFWPKFLLTHP